MTLDLTQKTFLNADQETVQYDGSPISWRVSAYVIIRQNSQVLIIKNRTEKLYDIIGGGIEFGEDIKEALARECMEEAGIQAKIGRLLDAKVNWFSHKNGQFYQTLQLFYEAELLGEMGQPTEEDIVWREFVPESEIGTTYKLPLIVEKVIRELLH